MKKFPPINQNFVVNQNSVLQFLPFTGLPSLIVSLRVSFKIYTQQTGHVHYSGTKKNFFHQRKKKKKVSTPKNFFRFFIMVDKWPLETFRIILWPLIFYTEDIEENFTWRSGASTFRAIFQKNNCSSFVINDPVDVKRKLIFQLDVFFRYGEISVLHEDL